MKHFGYRHFVVVATLLIPACSVSCNRPSSNTAATTSKSAKPGPEESLSQVMDVFTRRMEDTPIGFVTTNPSGRSAMTGKNKVSYKLVQPSTTGEPYKAIVTVVSSTHYSVLRTVDPSKDNGRDEAEKDKSAGIFDETDPNATPFTANESGGGTGAASTEKKGSTPSGEETKVGRNVYETTGTYELIYENGRWTLVTKLNDKTEKSIEHAFNSALGTQF